jgi:hypothetical protein
VPAPSVAAVLAAAPAPAAGKTADAGQCLETAPLAAADAATLQRSLLDAGVPAGALATVDAAMPGRWIVYMGRFTDDAKRQRKIDELDRMKLSFQRISSPPALSLGISLGNFSSVAAAQERLDELAKRGVRTARVVAMEAPGPGKRLRAKPADDAQARKLPANRFHACAG